MTHLHNLHIATETHDRPDPVFARTWYAVFIFTAGFLLGIAVMWMTDFTPPPMEIVVRP